MNNRKANATNMFQGTRKRVLCVCSAGLLRSPTAAWVLSNEPWGYNTRAAGLYKDFALIPVDDVLLHWADKVVCMTSDHAEMLAKMTDKEVVCLEVPDNFEFRDDALIRIIRERCKELGV